MIKNLSCNLYTAVKADERLLCNCASTALALTLYTPIDGDTITIVKTDSSSNIITVYGSIDGLSNITISSYNDFVTLQGQNGTWTVIEKGDDSSATDATYGDGVTGNSDVLAKKISDMGNTGTLTMLPGTYLIDEALTIPTGIVLDMPKGVILKPANGVALTVNGEIKAGLYQIFDLSLGGTLAGSPINPELYFDWVGCDKTGVTTNHTNFQKMLNWANGKEIIITEGTYLFSAYVATAAMDIRITGKGDVVIKNGLSTNLGTMWIFYGGWETTVNVTSISGKILTASNTGLNKGDIIRLFSNDEFANRRTVTKYAEFVAVNDPLEAFPDGLVESTNMKLGTYTLVGNPSVPRKVTLKHTVVSGVDTLGTVTVVGTDSSDAPLTEVLTPVSGTTVTSTGTFKTITSATGADWAANGTADTIMLGFADTSGYVVLTETPVFTYTDTVRYAKLKDYTCKIKNIIFESVDNTVNAYQIAINYFKYPVIDNCKMITGYQAFIQSICNFAPIFKELKVNFALNSPVGDHYGYGVNDFNSQYGILDNCHFGHLRHGFTTNNKGSGSDPEDFGETLFFQLNNCYGYNTTNAAFDTHEQGYGITYNNCHSIGSAVSFQIRADETIMNGCTSKGGLMQIFHYTDSTGHIDSINHVVVNNCDIVNNEGYGIYIYSFDASHKVGKVEIKNTNIKSSLEAIRAVFVDDISVLGGSFETSDSQMLYASDAKITMIGTKLKFNTGVGSKTIVDLSSDSTIIAKDLTIESTGVVALCNVTDSSTSNIADITGVKYIDEAMTPQYGVPAVGTISKYSSLNYDYYPMLELITPTNSGFNSGIVELVNVKNAGAIGNGTTDDKAKIDAITGTKKLFTNVLGRNGNFETNSGGLGTGWVNVSLASYSVTANVQTLVPDGINDEATYALTVSENDVLYACSYFKCDTNGQYFAFKANGSTKASATNPSDNSRGFVAILYKFLAGETTNVKLHVQNRSAATDPLYIDNVHVFNLTTIYGAGNEPNLATMNVIMQEYINSYGYLAADYVSVETNDYRKKELFFPTGTYSIQSAMGFLYGTKLKFERGAKLKPANGINIIVNADIEALHDYMDVSAGGTFTQKGVGAATPVGSILPLYVGQEYFDATGVKWYKATGLTTADWVALN